jgi:hypothetical protein
MPESNTLFAFASAPALGAGAGFDVAGFGAPKEGAGAVAVGTRDASKGANGLGATGASGLGGAGAAGLGGAGAAGLGGAGATGLGGAGGSDGRSSQPVSRSSTSFSLIES